MGVVYIEGEVFPKDYIQALHWFGKAAEQGHAQAQTNIGAFYEHGYGVDRDYKEAYFWTLLATASGDQLALENSEIIAALLTAEERELVEEKATKWMNEHH